MSPSIKSDSAPTLSEPTFGDRIVAPVQNTNVAMTVMLDADRTGLICLTADGKEYRLGINHNTGAVLRDYLRMTERKRPEDEGVNTVFHPADTTGTGAVPITRLPTKSRKLNRALTLEDLDLHLDNMMALERLRAVK